jgi:hypothetical protein
LVLKLHYLGEFEHRLGVDKEFVEKLQFGEPLLEDEYLLPDIYVEGVGAARLDVAAEFDDPQVVVESGLLRPTSAP